MRAASRPDVIVKPPLIRAGVQGSLYTEIPLADWQTLRRVRTEGGCPQPVPGKNSTYTVICRVTPTGDWGEAVAGWEGRLFDRHPLLWWWDRVIPWTALTTDFITTTGSSQTFSVPSDWNSSSNNCYAIGCGGSGYHVSSGLVGGGGGGAYATTANVSLTPSGSASYNLGTAGNNVDTQFVNSSTLVAKAGVTGTSGTGGVGGAAASCFPTTGAFSGGAGGTATVAVAAFCGGGGAGGPGGAGWAGGACSAISSTGGGGSDGGSGSNGTASSTNAQATNGGNGNGGTGGGAGHTSGNGTSGTALTGGGGGAATAAATTGGAGGTGIASWTATTGGATAGAGGGGGAALTGGAGGLYGGGGGGGSTAGGVGAQGIIVVTYTPGGGVVNHFLTLMGVGQFIIESNPTLTRRRLILPAGIL